MTTYLLKRVLLIVPTLFGIMLISFAIVQFAPGGPVERVIAQMSQVYKGNLFFGEDLLEIPVEAPHLDKLL